jgi:hypothetical protein
MVGEVAFAEAAQVPVLDGLVVLVLVPVFVLVAPPELAVLPPVLLVVPVEPPAPELPVPSDASLVVQSASWLIAIAAVTEKEITLEIACICVYPFSQN